LLYQRSLIQNIELEMTNKLHLDSLNPQKAEIFRTFIKRVKEELGWDIIIVMSYRSFSTQEKLHNTNSKNSLPGLSAHNYGFAIDCNFIKGTQQLKKDSLITLWEMSGIIKIADECGLRWGGYFNGYSDTVHFDCIKPGFTTKWLKYLKEIYPTNYTKIETNKMNWKFYEEAD
jgi:hypothetical protein